MLTESRRAIEAGWKQRKIHIDIICIFKKQSRARRHRGKKQQQIQIIKKENNLNVTFLKSKTRGSNYVPLEISTQRHTDIQILEIDC